MPKLANAYVTDRAAARASSHGDVTWAMEGDGVLVEPGATFTPAWWIENAGDLFLGARLSMSLRDGEALDALEVELWSQEVATGAGILAATFVVAPIAGAEPSELRTLGIVGLPGRGWGVRARMTTATARRVMFQLTCFCRFIGSGLLWRGAGVT